LIPLFTVGLFVCCMLCHGELARMKPSPRYLTAFYLMISLGGAIGGIFVGVVAPYRFHGFNELPIAIAACALIAAAMLGRELNRTFMAQELNRLLKIPVFSILSVLILLPVLYGLW